MYFEDIFLKVYFWKTNFRIYIYMYILKKYFEGIYIVKVFLRVEGIYVEDMYFEHKFSRSFPRKK